LSPAVSGTVHVDKEALTTNVVFGSRDEMVPGEISHLGLVFDSESTRDRIVQLIRDIYTP